MARPAEVPAVTSGQATFILEKLIDEGKVTAADVRRLLAGMWDEMNALERRISELRGIASATQTVRRLKRVVKRATAKTRTLSAKTRASYRLQGQFLGYLRQIPERDRAKYKRLAKTEGREKAVAAMKSALGKA